MDRLRLKSTNAFLQLVRKYPEGFVNVNPNLYGEKKPWYDKAALESFTVQANTSNGKNYEIRNLHL